MQTRFVYREMPLCYRQYNARGIENSKPTGHRVTTDLASTIQVHFQLQSSRVHWLILTASIYDLRKSRGLHSVSAYRHGLYI